MQNESPYYQLAKEFALSTNRSIFLTGKAGTGKTTFLRKLKDETKKQMAIVAPTGVAAINAGGTTMHSFFQLPFTPFLPTAEERKALIEKIKMVGNKRKVIQELELLVIDEISMVRADILDAVDTILRHIRYRHNEAFGGVQVIFIGDMFQLSPVAGDDEWRLLSRYYQSPYFFHSQVIQQQQPVYIELDKIFRQTNVDFIQVLNEVRNNCLSPQGLSLLQSRYNPLFVPPKDDTYITLTTHNYKADKINSEELAKISTKTYRFTAETNGDFPEKSYPTERELVLKIAAKVMFIKNDSETPRRFFNGKIGVIEDIDDDKIYIKCPGDTETIELEKAVWENIRYSTNEKTKQLEEDVIGKFVQFPLRLAWAITIHKSQGLTFEKAVIDAGDAFASGQVYVALSRCRTLEGLVLWSKINPNSIENDRQIVEHEKNKIPADELERQLTDSRNKFRAYTLNQLFDFRTGIGHISRLLREIKEVETSFNDETIPFLNDVLKQIQNIQEVADKFQHQLQNIFTNNEVNEDYLAERLTAATDFFSVKIETLVDTLNESPASTDSRENARDYNDQLKNCFAYFAQKLHIFKRINHPFTVDNYFELKNTFYMPEFNVSAYAKNSSTKQAVSRNQKLYYELLTIRNKICEPRDLPIYLVAGTKTLIEMADYLPLNEKDLLKIHGFGPSKVEKYGMFFLETIQRYCNDNKLQSLMSDKVETARPKKEKKEKTDKPEKQPKANTFEISLALYKSGKSIDQIASERGLATSTIATHLSRYIDLGQISINNFISEEKRNKALKLMQESSELGSIYQSLSTILDKTEVTFFLAWVRSKTKNE